METLIFLKYPLAGQVKTRLGREIGAEKACLLYRRFAEALVGELRRGGLDPVIFYDPAQEEGRYRRWLGPGRYRPQAGGDLGERIAGALEWALAGGAPGALLLGSDSPQLDSAWIARARARLERCPVVLGPTRDGGYYLVGVRGRVPDLFRGIPWSTAGVLEATGERARRLGLEVELLEETFDVDHRCDLARLLPYTESKPHLRSLRPLVTSLL